jgi:undecaprenyl-diphosphatase
MLGHKVNMTIFESIVLGIIQGIFMFFPVSSTSHLVLAQHWFIQRGSSLPAPESAEMILFDLVVHVGTLVSIVIVFRQSLSQLLLHIWQDIGQFLQKRQGVVASSAGAVSLPIDPMITHDSQKTTNEYLYLRLALLGIFSVIVTAAIGFPMRSLFKEVFATPAAICITLSITGILLWWTDAMKRQKRGLRRLNLWVATVIGFSQGLALIPGLSRSGMTISFALFTGLKRKWAAEYSFFIAFPTILAATAVQSLEIFAAGSMVGVDWLTLTIGFWVAAGVGTIALQIVLHLLYRAKFRYFSFYLWTLAAVVLISIIQGML